MSSQGDFSNHVATTAIDMRSLVLEGGTITWPPPAEPPIYKARFFFGGFLSAVLLFLIIWKLLKARTIEKENKGEVNG